VSKNCRILYLRLGGGIVDFVVMVVWRIFKSIARHKTELWILPNGASEASRYRAARAQKLRVYRQN